VLAIHVLFPEKIARLGHGRNSKAKFRDFPGLDPMSCDLLSHSGLSTIVKTSNLCKTGKCCAPVLFDHVPGKQNKHAEAPARTARVSNKRAQSKRKVF
jgi:hypothetical protein